MPSSVTTSIYPGGCRTIYGGTRLNGLKDSMLPFTSESHDLVHLLLPMVEDDGGKVNLNTTKIANCIKTFLQLMPVDLASFAKVFGLLPSQMLILLENPKNWARISELDKRSFLKLFLWLNLPARERQTVFESSNNSILEKLPSLSRLSVILETEIVTNKILLSEFSQKVARCSEETLVVNAIYNVFPEELLTPEYLACYQNFWEWLKMPKVDRLMAVEDQNFKSIPPLNGLPSTEESHYKTGSSCSHPLNQENLGAVGEPTLTLKRRQTSSSSF